MKKFYQNDYKDIIYSSFKNSYFSYLTVRPKFATDLLLCDERYLSFSSYFRKIYGEQKSLNFIIPKAQFYTRFKISAISKSIFISN